MEKHVLASLLLCAIIVGTLGSVSFVRAGEPTIVDGMLVRASDSSRVYYIDNGFKRWVNAPDTLRLQGLADLPIVIASPWAVAAVPEGERLTSDSSIVLPGESGVLPDLSPLAAEDVHLDTIDGRTVIRFSALFWNQGGGPLELLTETETFQRIVHADGTARDKVVGNFIWHAAHGHYHYSDFADYVFEPIRLDPGSPSVPATITQKTTFCMRDNAAVDLTLAGAPQYKSFTTCNYYRQGVSVGWADVYDYTLPDQYVDVQDMPPGVYRLSFSIDPRHHFVEKTVANNVSTVLIDLDVENHALTVLGSGAPFFSQDNKFSEGLVVKGEEKPGVYVIEKAGKRLLLTEDMFLEDGHDWDDIYVLPQSIVDSIPNAIIRETGTGRVYALNNEGYRRHIVNPEVFGSYGWTDADITDLDSATFFAYPETRLVARSGDDSVFSTDTKQYMGELGAIASVGYDPRSVHAVNETEIRAYAVTVAAQGLDVPWDVEVLPGGDLLVTERPGTLRRLGAQPFAIVVPDAYETGEGGLMGVALHPDFATNNLMYLYYTTTREVNRVARFRLEGSDLVFDKIIVDEIPSEIYHDGGQIAFGPDGMLYITTGDAYNADFAPDLGSIAGKTLRVTADGGIPSDNPFGSAIWSYGHRNAQGLAWDAYGHLWETEHGRSGATTGYDELNMIVKSGNYGWPDSQGANVVAGTNGPAIQSGADTTWAPSGIAYAAGRLFFAGLRGSSLYAATVDASGTVTDFDAYLTDVYGRLRAVTLGPDGMLYVTTSNRDGRGDEKPGDDQILRINPEFYR